MLRLPENASGVTSIVGIDPGTEMLGIAVLVFDVSTFEILSVQADTYKGSRLPGSEWAAYIHSDRYKRIASHKANLIEILNHYRPLFVSCESPFYNQKRPSAYGALTEIICAIREAVNVYDVWKPLYLIDPPSVKKAVNAAGNAGKDAVKASILQIKELTQVCSKTIEEMDEHSIDAMAVAYAQYVTCRSAKL